VTMLMVTGLAAQPLVNDNVSEFTRLFAGLAPAAVPLVMHFEILINKTLTVTTDSFLQLFLCVI